MVNSILSSQPSELQRNIDLVAQDLLNAESRFALPSADLLAELLELRPEQNVWMYEPDCDESGQNLVKATFRLHASTGIVFHISCQIDDHGNALGWMEPHDIVVPAVNQPTVKKALAA